MHKHTHRAADDEYPDDRRFRPVKNKRRSGRDRGDADQRRTSDLNSQWVFGNLFECLTDNEHCIHGRIPFGGSFYCAWPLKEASSSVRRKPPCSSDSEQDSAHGGEFDRSHGRY
ncbi:MAG: hypothetical protein PHF56_13605 [Desulfuromonadaceae bacterium]|nr:hypothetical protein [Desulfuromonadaceae bacterium]